MTESSYLRINSWSQGLRHDAACFASAHAAQRRRPHSNDIVVALLGMSMLAVVTLSAQRRPVLQDPVMEIIDAFDSHDVVALGEDHGNEQNHAFRLRLVRVPGFARAVDDIVVEFGNARYQGVIDRFMSGERVPDAVLRKAGEGFMGRAEPCSVKRLLR